MYLACPNRCSTNRFELWNASVFVDSAGRYLDYKVVDAPLYRCTECGSPEDRLAEESPAREFACPSCEELFSAPKEQLVVVCPACGQTFPVAEPT